MPKGNPKKPPGSKKSAVPPKLLSSWGFVIFGACGVALAIVMPHLLKYLFPHPEPKPRVDNGATQQQQQQSSPKAVCAEDGPPEHEMCLAWHKAGYCRGQRRGVSFPSAQQVQEQCARTCGLCPNTKGRNPPKPREDRCSRDNTTAAVPEGELNRLFERIKAEYPEYEPTFLSTSPYVLHLKNFISAEEAAAFQSTCKESFERSLAGDQLNPVRTSFQCWCNFGDCFANPLVHRVTRRINNLTNTPYDNGEDLQVVRYEPGQFYRVHHDQNTAVWAPQGPRVLTFFMYLNDVPSGGETAFPQIPSPSGKGHLIVQPRLGHAILWPSVFDERPMEADERTNHEAMPVHEGVKFGANMWIHQFSFKTPSERGCELTYVNTVGRQPQTREHEALVAGRVPTYEETVRDASQSKNLDPDTLARLDAKFKRGGRDQV